MKKFITLSAAVAALAIAAPLAAAPSSEGSVQLSPAQMQRLDTDKNGVVSRSEYQAFMEASFAKLDANGDGFLTKSELPADSTAEQFAAMDTNKDGKISRAEFLKQVMKEYKG